jgi:beta-lactamase superfamily II metal-dependent hydrolase
MWHLGGSEPSLDRMIHNVVSNSKEQIMQLGDEVFVSYPSAVHYGEKGAAAATRGKKPLNQLLWGDWAKILEISGNWVKIRSRRNNGWVRKENLQTERILEVNFVDIGQGDGCHIQTAEDKSIIIDAGERDNMYRFLRWRFGKFAEDYTFESFIISHPDKDHYLGFEKLLDHPKVHVDAIHHNTIVEQVTAGKSTLGAEKTVDGKKFLSGLVRTHADLLKITDSAARRGARLYPNMLKKAVESGRVNEVVGLLASRDFANPEYLPGYAPGDNRGMTLKLLGPVPQDLGDGKLGLPKIGNTGETKNGHSVALILEIGHVRMLLGGDLNDKSQDYLLEFYTGLDPNPSTPAEIETLVAEGRKHLEVDIAKACHHGSPHVAPNFLQSTNPLVTVISSGDDEPHCHPRPDTLGIIGKYGRGDRPLIFSTELARSSSEKIKHPNQVRSELRKKIDAETAVMNDPNATEAAKKKASEQLDKHLEVIERSVASYGMINVRTDGERVLIAQRLERKRSKSTRWDIHCLETDNRGRLHYMH